MNKIIPANELKIVIRDAEAEDLVFLEKLYLETRKDEFSALGWDDDQLEMLLKMQFKIQTQAYKMQYPGARISVIETDGAAVGRMITTDEIILVDIAVLPEWQNHGIGSFVLKGLLSDADSQKKSVYLQVLKSNVPAFRLYERLGFEITGEDELNLMMRRNMPQ